MSKTRSKARCPIAERFADEFNHDADICVIGADWLLSFAGRNEKVRLAAGALLAVASRLRGFHADFRVWRSHPPCEWRRTIDITPEEARRRLAAMDREWRRECRRRRGRKGGRNHAED